MAAIIVLFVVYYQRKMLIKEAHIKLMEQEKQIELFKASVEAEEKQKESLKQLIKQVIKEAREEEHNSKPIQVKRRKTSQKLKSSKP